MITHAERERMLTQWAAARPDFADSAAEATARVRYHRGEANEHICACGAPATEWQIRDLNAGWGR